jgi:hypothetical protein
VLKLLTLVFVLGTSISAFSGTGRACKLVIQSSDLESIATEAVAKQKKLYPGLKTHEDGLLQAMQTNRQSSLPFILKLLSQRLEISQIADSNTHFVFEAIQFLSEFGRDSTETFNEELYDPASSLGKEILRISVLTEGPENQAQLLEFFRRVRAELNSIESEKAINGNTHTRNNLNIAIQRVHEKMRLNLVEFREVARLEMLSEVQNQIHEKIHVKINTDNLERTFERNDLDLVVKALVLKARAAKTQNETSLAVTTLMFIGEMGQDTSVYRYEAPPEKASSDTLSFINSIVFDTLDAPTMARKKLILARAMAKRILAEQIGRVLTMNRALNLAISEIEKK